MHWAQRNETMRPAPLGLDSVGYIFPILPLLRTLCEEGRSRELRDLAPFSQCACAAKPPLRGQVETSRRQHEAASVEVTHKASGVAAGTRARTGLKASEEERKGAHPPGEISGKTEAWHLVWVPGAHPADPDTRTGYHSLVLPSVLYGKGSWIVLVEQTGFARRQRISVSLFTV